MAIRNLFLEEVQLYSWSMVQSLIIPASIVIIFTVSMSKAITYDVLSHTQQPLGLCSQAIGDYNEIDTADKGVRCMQQQYCSIKQHNRVLNRAMSKWSLQSS